MKKINIKGDITMNDSAAAYEWLGWDCACPRALEKELEEAAGDDVVLEINSPGGVCVAGYEMYKAIKEYKGKVTAHVISAMSAATLIACAADETLISDAGVFMIHNAQSSARGDYRDMDMEAEALREFNAGIINIYEKKTGKSREEIQALMDKNSYMSPQTAIENGFVDGYIFGESDPAAVAQQIVAAEHPVITADKAKALMRAIHEAENKDTKIAPVAGNEGNISEVKAKADVAQCMGGVPQGAAVPEDGKVAPVQQANEETGESAVPDKSSKGGRTNMTLAEFLAENPEAKAELDTAVAEAKAEGVKTERARIQSLDDIAKTVTAEALTEAKYGENPIDGPTLAYQAMKDGEKLACAYMEAAKNDAQESGTSEVGTGNPDAGQEPTDEADEMAAYVNKNKGGK
jgi:ATP-dependent protease ClpP protease subunit